MSSYCPWPLITTNYFPKVIIWSPDFSLSELMIGLWRAGRANVNFPYFPMRARQQPENETIEQTCSGHSPEPEKHGPVFTRVDFFPPLFAWTETFGSSLTLRQHLPSGANHVLRTLLLYACWSSDSIGTSGLPIVWVRHDFFYIKNSSQPR